MHYDLSDNPRFEEPQDIINNYALRPIYTTFTATISNGAEYQNPGY